MKKCKIVNYRFGIFKDIPLEDFINQVLEEEQGYELKQVVDYSFWTPAGFEYVRYLVLWATEK